MKTQTVKTILALIFGVGIGLNAAAASADVDYSNADTGSTITLTGNDAGNKTVFSGWRTFNDPE